MIAETTREALDSIATSAPAMRDSILKWIVSLDDGATADEVEAHFEWLPQSVTPRLWELQKMGLVVRSGTKRATRTGRAAGVYVPTEAGLTYYDDYLA